MTLTFLRGLDESLTIIANGNTYSIPVNHANYTAAEEEEEVVCVIRVIDDNGVVRLSDSTVAGGEPPRCGWTVHTTDSVGPDPTAMRLDSVGPDPTE